MATTFSPTAALVGPAFLRRVYLTSLVVSAVGGLVLAARIDQQWGLGFFAFGAWSTLNLWALERVMRMLVTTEPRDPLGMMFALIFKIPIVYGTGALIAIKGGFDGVALISGFSVPFAVMVLKIFGDMLARRVALPERPDVDRSIDHRPRG